MDIFWINNECKLIYQESLNYLSWLTLLTLKTSGLWSVFGILAELLLAIYFEFSLVWELKFDKLGVKRFLCAYFNLKIALFDNFISLSTREMFEMSSLDFAWDNIDFLSTFWIFTRFLEDGAIYKFEVELDWLLTAFKP